MTERIAQAARAFPWLYPVRPLVLVNGHHRESFGAPFRELRAKSSPDGIGPEAVREQCCLGGREGLASVEEEVSPALLMAS